MLSPQQCMWHAPKEISARCTRTSVEQRKNNGMLLRFGMAGRSEQRRAAVDDERVSGNVACMAREQKAHGATDIPASAFDTQDRSLAAPLPCPGRHTRLHHGSEHCAG